MPRNGVVFPYGITLREGGALDTFPVAEVFFFSRENERLSLFLLIDSGATISALPVSDASMLGVEVEEGISIRITGIDGKPVEGWRHEVKVEIAEKALRIPIVFLKNKEAPRILGREGMFDQFTLIFQEHKNRTGFLSPNTTEIKAFDTILDNLR